MKKLLLLSSLLILTACGQRHKNHQAQKASVPAIEKQVFILTPEEEKFVADAQEELDLSGESVEVLKEELQKKVDPYTKARTMFCSEAGVAAFFDLISFRCHSFKGDRISMRLKGLGASLAMHTGVTILYSKKGSRDFKEGTYNVNLGAVHRSRSKSGG